MTTKLVAAAAASLAIAGAAPIRAADAPAPNPAAIAADTFFAFPEMSHAVLSPHGTAMAILVRNKAGRRQLAVVDTNDLANVRIVGSFAEYDIENAHWVNDKRLVFQLFDEATSAWAQRGAGLFSIDRDGQNFRALIPLSNGNHAPSHIASRELSGKDYRFTRTLSDGSDDIVVSRVLWETTTGGIYIWSQSTGTVPMRLNTRTGQLHDMVAGTMPDGVFTWAIDAQAHVLAGMSIRGDQAALVTHEEGGGWKELAHMPAYAPGDGFSLLGDVPADGHPLVVKADADAAGSRAIYRLDLATGQPGGTAIARAAGFDLGQGDIDDDGAHKLLGVRYDADAPGTAWFDPDMKAVQAKVDARLRSTVNQLQPASCGCSPLVLVTAFSDTQPPIFLLYDKSNDSLKLFGRSRPAIDASQMAVTDFARIKARDGEDVPVYVTKPHGKGPWPAVVLVHGGPWVRGWHWCWDGESQFLASRGYLVIKPEFRGSVGYGYRHYMSGLKQWGLAMQDDIADATLWAEKQGLADPKRVCIAGASYGGYATLMGLVRYSDLYACGVASSAVTDIDLMYAIDWSDASSDYKQFGMPVLIGDRVKDAAQLEATSPLKQAAKIKRPLLLAHGGIDRRVPIEHAVKMRDALLADHAPVTWIEYKDEAHGWTDPQTRVDYYQRVQAFLDANIGPGAAGGAKPAVAQAVVASSPAQ